MDALAHGKDRHAVVPGGRAWVIFESMFGNTQRLAHAVGWGLRAAGMDVTVLEVASAPTEFPAGLDLLVLGAPTHAFRLSTPGSRAEAHRHGAPDARVEVGMREWLTSVDWTDAPPDVAVFDTRLDLTHLIPVAASRQVQVLLERRGCRITTRPVTFIVDGMKGPVGPRELDRATAWGRRLAGIAQLSTVLRNHRPADSSSPTSW
jgi:hypothetical protein